MICPYCEQSMTRLSAKRIRASGQNILALACPSCKKVVGIVNKTD